MARLRLRLVAAALLAAVSLAGAPPPSLESYFGHKMGADRTVLDWDRVVSYFRALASSSDRLVVRELGQSTEGRPFIAAFLSSPKTLRRLDRQAWIQSKLADPRVTSEAEAGQLIAEAKAVVMITCSIHSTELASTHTAVEFAYRLLTEDTAAHRSILDNTILVLVPSLNPDGLDLVTRWYRKTLGGPFEGTSPPELYQKYAGHDNNRDWYFFTQAETRLAVAHLHNVWHPHIVYDVHQQGERASRMFVPPWTDPIDPNIDAILAQECNSFGTGMAADLTAAGKRGVVIHAIYDFWSPSRAYQAYHGGLRILSEAASARLASPVTVAPDQIDSKAIGYDPRERSWNYLEPWTGGEWRLRDIVDYQLISMGSLAALAAQRREALVRGAWRIAKHALERGGHAAWVIPFEQSNPGAARKMLETLAFGMVEAERAESAFEAGGTTFPAGSYVIRLAQPYGPWAKTLLERQRYPGLKEYPGGPPKRPYDVTAQTLPLLMGVDAQLVDPLPQVRLARAREFRFPAADHVLAASDSDSWREINRVWKAGGTIWRNPGTGDFQGEAGNGAVRIERPRIGLYKSYVPEIDEGWTRWVLEQFGFPYTSLRNPDIEAGGLRRRFDVIIFPDQAPRSIAQGYAPGSMPAEFMGGIGERGLKPLQEFATDGGTLVFLNRSARWAQTAFGLNLMNVVEGLPEREYYAPGSLLNAAADPQSPLSRGLPAKLALWAEESPAWEIPDGSEARAAVRYAPSEVLASGWLLGEKHIAGKAAVVEYPWGAGRLILEGTRPQYRGQSYGTFPLLFNALVESGTRRPGSR